MPSFACGGSVGGGGGGGGGGSGRGGIINSSSSSSRRTAVACPRTCSLLAQHLTAGATSVLTLPHPPFPPPPPTLLRYIKVLRYRIKVQRT